MGINRKAVVSKVALREARVIGSQRAWSGFYSEIAQYTAGADDENKSITRIMESLRSFFDASQVVFIEMPSQKFSKIRYYRATNKKVIPLENAVMAFDLRSRNAFGRYYLERGEETMPRHAAIDTFTHIERSLLRINKAETIRSFSINDHKKLVGVILIENPKNHKNIQLEVDILRSYIINLIKLRDFKQESANNNEAMDFLKNDYEALCLINFESNTIYDFIVGVPGSNGQAWNPSMHYAERTRQFTETFVAEGFQATYVKRMSPKTVLEKLEKSDHYDVDYPITVGGKKVYKRNRFMKASGDQSGRKVIMGVSSIDEHIRVVMDRQRLVNQQGFMIQALSADYEDIHLIDLNTDHCRHLFMSDFFYKRVRPVTGSRTPFSKMIAFYAEQFVHPDDRKEFMETLQIENLKAKLAHTKKIEVEYRLLDPETMTYEWSECKIVNNLEDETGSTVIIGYRNIDVRKREEIRRAQDLQEAKERAEAASRSKTTFLLNMSHDIRTPMNAILGFSDLVVKHLGEEEVVKEYMNRVKTAGGQLMRLINDVLDMARIESGKTEIKTEPTDIIRLTNEMIESIALTAQKGGVMLESDMRGIKDRNLLIDCGHFERIMLNIVSNAIKYTEPGGKVKISMKQVPCEEEEKAGFEISVEDNGIGMSADYMEHIFEPFTRAETSTRSGIIGAGLGMSITKSLIDMMDGDIDIYSEISKGTTVIVKLSFTKCAGEKNEVQHKVRESTITKKLVGMKILLVEDNELNSEIACEILKSKEVVVDVAENGLVAVEKMRSAKEDTYDAILMDIQMPIMDGYEATRQIREMDVKKKAHIPIIAMTANAFEEDRRKAYECGMNAHITKPIDVGVLCETLAGFVKKGISR